MHSNVSRQGRRTQNLAGECFRSKFSLFSFQACKSFVTLTSMTGIVAFWEELLDLLRSIVQGPVPDPVPVPVEHSNKQ